MTKKVGHILEKVADEDNLRLAIQRSQKGGKAKRSKQIRAVNANIEEVVARLRRQILTLDFPEHNARKMQRRTDRGKVRDLEDEDYDPWKIMSHAIMQVIEPYINKKMIADTSSCIRKRGCLYGVKRMQRIMRRYPDHVYFSQSDCKKYYQGLDPDYMVRVFRHWFKDEKFIRLIEICVLDYYCGDEIIQMLEDERKTKERSANWLIRKRDDWEPRPFRDRPHPHRKVRGQDRAELRRCCDIRSVKSGNQVPAERVQPALRGTRDGSEGGQFLRGDRRTWQEKTEETAEGAEG